MKTEPHNPKKSNPLEAQIEKIYGWLTVENVEALETKMNTSVTEMFEVTRISSASIDLGNLFENQQYTNVKVPDSILSLLKINDSFLITLGHNNDGWSVIYMSPPYQSAEWE